MIDWLIDFNYISTSIGDIGNLEVIGKSRGILQIVHL